MKPPIPPSATSPAVAPYAGLDPGRSKCGLVRSDEDAQEILSAGVLEPEICWRQLEQWCQQGLIAAVVLGNGTGSAHWQQQLARLRLPVVLAVQRAAHNLHVASGRGGDRRAPRHPRVHVPNVTFLHCGIGAECSRFVAAAFGFRQRRGHFDELRGGRGHGGNRPCFPAIRRHLGQRVNRSLT